MEGRETDLEYNLLMGLTGASVSKHLLDEHFTLLWANDFYYDMIGYPKEEYEALFHNKPDLYFKGYDEAWNILSKNVYETIANKASGYETVIQMPTRKGKRWTKITSTFTDQLQDGIPISYTVMTDVEDVMRRRIEQTITYDNIPGFISKHKVHKDGSFTLLEANDKYMDFSGIDKNSFLSFSPFSRLDETSRNTMNAHISCMLKGEPVHFVIQSKDKNGNDLYSAANSYVYQYNSPHGLRMSSSDNSGYIVTSELDLSAPFSVLISAKVWPKDTSGIKVTAGESAAITTADLTEEFKSYLLKFDAQNSKTKIRIEPSATNERIIIESIQIVSGHDVTLPPVLKITSETTLSVPAESTIKTINYTVENPTNGVSVVASSDVSWLNSFVYNVDGVSFTIDANQGEERSGTITLSYEGAEAQTISVTQTKPGAVMWETETFENYTVPSTTSYGSSGTFNGVTTGTPQWSYSGCGNPNQANTDKTALANAGVVVINDKYAAIGKNGSMSVTIPGGITALKFNALTSSKGSATVTITANGATVASITIPGNSKSAFEIPTIDCQGYDATITIKQNNQNRTTIGDITWQPAN